MPLYDALAIPTKTLSCKLDDTGERELGEGKTSVEAGEGRLYALWKDDPTTLREYNIRDADLVRRIDEMYGLVELLYVICNICNYPPSDACYVPKNGRTRLAIGMVVDSYVLTIAHRRGIPQRNRRSRQKPADFPGGYVLNPKTGLYDWVVTPDYSGMYPNIIRAFNFGEETWVPDTSLRLEDGKYYITDGEFEGCRAIKGATGAFVHPDDGVRSIPAEAADGLVAIRQGAEVIVDKGVKAANNTLYGIFASDFHRYFGPHSENITLIGQQLTGTVEEIAASGHPDIKQVIYGDTDSVILEMRVGEEDPVDVAHRIASSIQAEMRDWAEGQGALVEYLTLDVDDVYSRFYIGDKKKRYFGRRIYDGEPCDDFKVRGFEMRQNDWPLPVRQFQERLAKAKLDGEPVGSIVRETRDRLYAGDFDEDLATSTTLTKPVEAYDSPLPHTRAAKMLREEFGKSSVRPGDKVTYIK